MTRTQVNARLRGVYIAIAIVLLVSALAAFAAHVPGLPKALTALAQPTYEFLRDMSLLIATLAAAYLANVFQKRSTFVQSLEQEWRNIVRTKSALFTYCETPAPTHEQYLKTFCALSETIDTMRVVYRNAGETGSLVGLYPYAPLHDMRRVLQSLDPLRHEDITPERRALARDAILQTFYALRENFLEELDLEEPTHPLLISGGWRLKKSGATRTARNVQKLQRDRQNATAMKRPDIQGFLAELYDAEEGTGARRLSGDQPDGEGRGQRPGTLTGRFPLR